MERELTRQSQDFLDRVADEEGRRGGMPPPRRWLAEELRRLRDDRFVASLDAGAAARAQLFAPGERRMVLRYRTFLPEHGDIEMVDVSGA